MADVHEAPDDAGPSERDDAFAERIAAPLRAAELPDPLLGSRILGALRADAALAASARATLLADERTPAGPPPTAARRGARRQWTFTIGVAPLAGLAAAAALVVAVLVGGTRQRSATPAVASAPRDAATPAPARVDTVHLVRFVFVAPDARDVALVGDFNGWDRTAVRLSRTANGGAWTATVALPAGRHEYAFLVDGDRWVADPNAPASIEDEFGVESSVLTVDAASPPATRRS